MSTMVEFQARRRRELELWAAGYRKGIDPPGKGMWPAVLPIQSYRCRCTGIVLSTGRCVKCGTFYPEWKR